MRLRTPGFLGGPRAARRRLRGVAVAVAVASCLLLSGCFGLATEGPVRQGLDVAGSTGDPLSVRPPGPVTGEAPESIIRGFLRAGTASQGDMSVARSFLTDDLAPMWNPDAGTTVLGNIADLRITHVSGDAYRLVGDPVATIDSSGRYEYAKDGQRVRAMVTVAKQGDEWRISGLPEDFGRWIDQDVLGRLFRPFNVYYVALGTNGFIPDVRWLPLDRQATRLARATLMPVPDYLSGAAQNVLGNGMSLTVDAVPVLGGVATVDLSAVGLPSDQSARKNIWGQLVATLTQAADVSAVNVTVEGAFLSVPDVTGPVSSLAQLGMSLEPSPTQAEPVMRIGQKVVPVQPSRILAPGDDDLANRKSDFPTVPKVWNRLAESRSGEEIAAVGTDGGDLARWRSDRTIEVPFFATNLTRPSYDRHDILWVGGQGTGSAKDVRLWALNTAADPSDAERAAPIPIRAAWLDDRVVTSVRVSPDGQRLAVVTTNAKGKDSRVEMAGILRAPNGVPDGLSPVTREIAPYFSQVRDVAWVSSTSLAALGRIGAEPVRPYVIEIGGEREALNAVPGAASITTTGGERGLAVITRDGKVFLRAGQSWLRAPAGSDLAMPGQ